MSSCEDTRRDAALLMSLPAGTPEREAAVAHARGCPECARALGEAALLVEAIDAHLALPPLDGAAMSRAEAKVLAAIELLEAGARRRERILLGASTAAAFGLLVAIARQRALDLPALASAAAVAGLAVILATQARASGALQLSIACVASAVFGALVSSVAEFAPLVGLKCVALELLAAACPLVAAARTTSLIRWPASAWSAASLAAAGALAGHAALHLTCPARLAEPHLLVFHTGGVVLAAAIGAAAVRLARAPPAS